MVVCVLANARTFYWLAFNFSTMSDLYTRTPEIQNEYDLWKQNHTGLCPFCGEAMWSQRVEAFDRFVVLFNKYPYKNALYHFLVVPKQHVDGMHELSVAQRAEHWHILDIYTRRYKGLEYLTRAPSNTDKSVAHLHTHLILWNKQPTP